jgi:hypothetical protein
VLGRAGDDPIEQRPAIDAAVVGRRLSVFAIGTRRRRHLRRVAAHEIEPLAGDRGVAVAQPRIDRDAVQRGVRPHRGDGGGHDVRRDHDRARLRREHGRQSQPGAELQHVLAGSDGEMTAEEARAGFGRLHAVGNAEQAVTPRVEENALVHYLPCTRRK